MNLSNHRFGMRYVFQYLSTKGHVKVIVGQRKLLSTSHDIHQRRVNQIYCHVMRNERRQKGSIRLNSSTHVEDTKRRLRKPRKPLLKQLTTLTQNQPARIGDGRVEALSAFMVYLIQGFDRCHAIQTGEEV